MRYVNNANGRMPVILRPDDEPLAQSRAVRCADRRPAQILSGAGGAQRTRAVRLHARSRCRSGHTRTGLGGRSKKGSPKTSLFCCRTAGSYFSLIRFAACVAVSLPCGRLWSCLFGGILDFCAGLFDFAGHLVNARSGFVLRFDGRLFGVILQIFCMFFLQVVSGLLAVFFYLVNRFFGVLPVGFILFSRILFP